MILTFPPYVYGIFYSFGFLLALGPAFFYLISLSITKGFRSGAMFAAGIVLSDVVIMAVIYFGFGSYFEDENFKAGFSFVGGVILFLMGIKFLLEKELNIEKERALADKSLIGYSLKGFLMNISNPFAFIIWLTIKTTIISAHPGYQHLDYMLFFAGLFGALLFLEVSKAFLADKIGGFLTSKVLLIVHKLLGIVFVCIAVWLFYKLYEILM
jgi:threonine/homoserine/homoserine lactone efflux protein